MPNGLPAYNSMTLDESTLYRLAKNKAVLSAFPVFKQLLKAGAPGGGCGRCQRRKAAVRTATYGAVKQALANLDSAKRNQLKSLLSAKEIRIVVSPSYTAIL